MRALLFIGHGSRNSIANEQFISFAQVIFSKLDIQICEYAFIELTSPCILEGIEKCVQKGATDIFIFPLLLLKANHALIDIPKQCNEATSVFHDIRITVGEPLGIQTSIIDYLHEKLIQVGWENDQKQFVLFVGRGSSNGGTISDFIKIKEMLQDQYRMSNIECCFLASATPEFSKALKDVINRDVTSIFVLPYLLFDGILNAKIDRELNKYTDAAIIKCSSLARDFRFQQLIIDVIKDQFRTNRM